MIRLPRLLLIAGTGRDSGKTTLACMIITKFSSVAKVVSFKISPHFHKIETGGKIMVREDQFYVIGETDPGTGKDSSRMLAAGAACSYFLAAGEGHLGDALRQIIEITHRDTMIVCESGGLRNVVEPGLFFITCGQGNSKIKPELVNFDHIKVPFDGNQISFDINKIVIQDNCWKLAPQHDQF